MTVSLAGRLVALELLTGWDPNSRVTVSVASPPGRGAESPQPARAAATVAARITVRAHLRAGPGTDLR